MWSQSNNEFVIFNFSNTSVGRLRLAGITEGISFLVLLFIAMPLKYWAGMPLAVKYTGWAHGVLFVLYGICLIMAWQERQLFYRNTFKKEGYEPRRC